MTSKTDYHKKIESIVLNVLENSIKTIVIIEELSTNKNPDNIKITQNSVNDRRFEPTKEDNLMEKVLENNLNITKTNNFLKMILEENENSKKEIILSIENININNHQENPTFDELKSDNLALKELIKEKDNSIKDLNKNKDNLANLLDQLNKAQDGVQKQHELLKEQIKYLKENQKTQDDIIEDLRINLKNKDIYIEEMLREKSTQNNIIEDLKRRLNLAIAVKDATTKREEIQRISDSKNQTTIGYIEHVTSLGSTGEFNVKKIDEGSFLYEVRRNFILIGRGDFCNIIIPSQDISIAHALLIYIPEHKQFLLYDLDSRNGTFASGKKIDKPCILNFGDWFTVCNSEHFRLHMQA